MPVSDRQPSLDLYSGLRVTDVSDGIDEAGRQDLGLMAAGIRRAGRELDRTVEALPQLA